MLDLTSPSAEASRGAEEALRTLTRTGDAPRLRLQAGAGTEDVVLPAEVVPLLVEILGQIANGNGVRVVPVHAELTTQQAADLLNVSRPHLVKLLETGAIPFHLVGTHRRVRLHDVLTYRTQLHQHQDALLDELAAEAQKLGRGY